MSRSVLDASALLAYLLDEPGADVVTDALVAGASMCTVNFSEVLAKLEDHGIRVDVALKDLTERGILDTMDFVDFTVPLAEEAARLRASTMAVGLSLGDRTCLALAKSLGLPAVTADTSWAAVPGVSIRFIR